MGLNQSDKKRLSNFYSPNLKKYGLYSAASVRWINVRNQYARFETLTQIGDLNYKKVLDVGSGLGDLWHFLYSHFTDVEYLGIDALPEMVKSAKRKYPHVLFLEKEVFEVTEEFDYVLSSGAMTFNVRGGKDYYFSMIKKMYDLAKVGVAFNMLDKSHSSGDENFLVYDPYEVSSFCKTFAKNHKIVVGYLPGDFTVFLYKH